MCAAGVTVVVLCVCMYVCMYVYVFMPPHTLKSQNRDTTRFIAVEVSFSTLPIFGKMLVQKLRCNMPTSSSFGVLALFSPRNKFVC